MADETDVDQVSLPMRIALLAVLAFAGLWLVALRPKVTGTGAATTPPAATQPANGVLNAPKKAEKAVAEANQASAKRETAAAKAAESKPAAAKSEPAAAPKAKPAKPAAAAETASGPAATPASGVRKARDEKAKVKRVLADIDAKKVVVLLFWDRRSADDREVYRAVESSARHGGKVSVRAAPIQQLGEYDKITKGLPIAGSPSVVVIDRAKRATVISGLTVTAEVDAVVKRALARR
jgi:hypothetical protein